jgi:hypothetical protein
MMHRYTLANGLRPALPLRKASDMYAWPDAAKLPQSIANIPDELFHIKGAGTGRRDRGFDVLTSATYRYDRKVVSAVVAGAPHVSMVRDPVRRLLDLWESPEFGVHRQSDLDPAVTLDAILKDPDVALKKLSPLDRALVFNGQVRDTNLYL